MIKIFTTGGTFDKVYFDALSEFRIGDPIADANRLQDMLAQLGGSLGLPVGLASGKEQPDEATLTRVLTSLGADPQLIENLGKLLEHFRAATEHSLAPGAN